MSRHESAGERCDRSGGHSAHQVERQVLPPEELERHIVRFFQPPLLGERFAGHPFEPRGHGGVERQGQHPGAVRKRLR